MGLAKLYEISGGHEILLIPDPIFGIPYKKLLGIAAIFEIGVAISCLSLKLCNNTKAICLIVLGNTLAAYRAGLWAVGWDIPCSCMGGLADGLGLSLESASRISLGVIIYLITGGYLTLFIKNQD